MVHSLRHFALGVPDLKAGEAFYAAFGLNKVERADQLAFHCDGRSHDEVILIETGKGRRVHHVSFGTDAADLEQIAQRLKTRDIPRLPPPYPGAPEGLWFRDLDGNLVHVGVVAAASQVSEPAPAINRPGNVSRRAVRGCPTPDLVARPRRLGHIILFTPDVGRQLNFYVDILGMRPSDTIQNAYGAFLRTSSDSDHHVLGLLNAPTSGFHHASFEMGSIDETELGALRLFGKGYKHAWGPGRHAIGSNYFHYFRDPWNGLAEYFFDIDYIPDAAEWHPKDWTKKEGMFLWSADGPPPSDFGQNFQES